VDALKAVGDQRGKVNPSIRRLEQVKKKAVTESAEEGHHAALKTWGNFNVWLFGGRKRQRVRCKTRKK